MTNFHSTKNTHRIVKFYDSEGEGFFGIPSMGATFESEEHAKTFLLLCDGKDAKCWLDGLAQSVYAATLIMPSNPTPQEIEAFRQTVFEFCEAILGSVILYDQS